jgi:aspartyl-tRNA(Asn)/glutamyl-tRNA(Gln) amidotransferase subunit B
METGEEAELFIRQLRRMVRYLGVCDGNMEEGSLRADANVSINFPGMGLGKKVEIKNLNSSRFVKLSLNHDIERQGRVLDSGGKVVQETRLWNENRDQTEAMRQKENAQDYRYFPEPDLPVFAPDAAFLERVERSLVELPQRRISRVREEYGLNEEYAELICDEKAPADYFEEAVSAAVTLGAGKKEAAGRIANWLLSDIRHILAKQGIALSSIGTLKLLPKQLAVIAAFAVRGKLSGKNARQTLELAAESGRDPETVIRENGWEQLADPAKIAEAVNSVYGEESAVFAEARAAASNPKRKRTLTAFLVGKVLAVTGGRADPKIAGEQVEKLITEG